jgi:hypothetical protein
MSDWLHAVRFRPRLFDSLRGYTRRDLRADVGAGATVGVIALPLSMAFAIASGLPPQAGLVTAIVAGFLISALGGSRVQIGGPSAVYIVIAYGVVVHYGAAGLVVCTIGAGVLLLAMGLARLGALIRFIPVSIVIGFTNGIAVLIVLSQLSDLLGLDAPVPEEYFRRVHALAANIGHVDPVTLAVSVACIAVLLLWPRAVATEGHALAEDGAREQHGPERHQIEEQHHADHVADDDRPVEGGVGAARRDDQQPERRRVQQLADRFRADCRDREAREREHQRRRPERVQAVRLQVSERPPRRAPDERIEDQRRRRPCARALRAARAQCLSRRAIASRCSSSSWWRTRLDWCQRRISHIVAATSTPKTPIETNAVRPKRVMPV